MVLTTGRFLEVAIESWPEWNLNPRPLKSVQTLQPTELSGHECNTHSANFGRLLQFKVNKSVSFNTCRHFVARVKLRLKGYMHT